MIDNTRVLSKQLAFGLSGFSILFSVITTSLLVFTDARPVHYNQIATIIILVSTFVLLPVITILATKYKSFKLPAIIIVHITFMGMLVFFNEVNGPFTALWTLVILIATLYYGWYGFIMSSLCLPFMTTLYVAMFGALLLPDSMVYTSISVMVNTVTILTAFLFVRVIMNSRKKNHDLGIAQKSEQMQVNRLNTLLNSISDAVLTLNRYGRVTSQNAAAQAFFDTNESLIGRDIDKILQLTDITDRPVSPRDMMGTTKSTILRDDLSTGRGGDTRHLSLQMSRIRSTFDDNEEYGVVVIIRDITKQKTLEQEKDEFISVTSHELRTPVAIAEGSLSNLLVMEERQASSEKLHESAATAHEQVLYLAKMINDLSTLSRAERGVGDEIEEINVNLLLRDLFEKYTPEMQEKSLILDLDVEPNLPKVKTSRLYLEEILENFLTNALKYTKEGTVTIGARLNKETGLRLWVKDSGIGMSKTDLEHIFEKFYRSEDYRTRETGGTGLGLYVVSKLAAKLNTKIEVESRLNHGSTFGFTLALSSRENGQVTEGH